MRVRRRDTPGPTRNEPMCTYQSRRSFPIIAALGLLVAAPLGAGDQLTISVAPGVAFAPATVVVKAAAQQDRSNRSLKIELESAEYYRSSLIQLDGADAAVTSMVRYEGVPGGTYEVRATLYGAGGEQRAATVRGLEVIPNSGR
jgi:hypothetical protein